MGRILKAGLTGAAIAIVLLLETQMAPANVIGMNVIAKPVTRERIATLPKKEQKAWLAYLNRSEKQKTLDKQTLKSEQTGAGNTNPKHAPIGRGAYALRMEHPAEWYT